MAAPQFLVKMNAILIVLFYLIEKHSIIYYSKFHVKKINVEQFFKNYEKSLFYYYSY
jgi:hypothetical protein